MGTAHLLDALRGVDGTRVAVMVTTDKVYRNLEHPYPYREDDMLGGHDPYSASKAASELVITSYRDAFLSQQGLAVASARAGNVIGGGDWAQDRLIPDCIRAWQSGQTLVIRRPDAIRPWQHVLEPLAGYLRLAEALWQQPALAGAYNLGPPTDEAATVKAVVELARSPRETYAVSYEIDSNSPHEAGWLALETAKARTQLGIHPRWTLTEAVQRTMAWYEAQHAGADARALCEADIAAYEGPP
jgi:CDP-glucose 4,6-dehydratase